MRIMTGCFAVALAVFLTACGNGPVSPGDVVRALTEQAETQNIVFRFSSGDTVDTDWQQRFHDWVTGVLGIQLPAKLRYNKYRDRAQIEAVTGRQTNGFAEPESFTVHSIWERDGHEAVHVYSARVGRASDFFNEGIAVALNTEPGAVPWTSPWNGTHVYAHTRLLINTGQLRPLAPMLTTGAFRNVDEWIGYGEAGSFSLFLIEQHGIGPMLTFFGMSTRDDSQARIEGNIVAVWGKSIGQLETEWLAHVEAWGG